jgi:glycosyltransferase involved in cell wall biosynthesis
LVVIPTLYEAGSFPLLEAMSLQAPVICSSVTSLPETIGDTRFVFDPLDIEKMASLIIELLDDSELRATNIVNGKQRIKKLIKIDSFPYFIKAWKSMINRCNSSTP